MSKVIVESKDCDCTFEVWIKVTFDNIRINKETKQLIFDMKKECRIINTCPVHERQARNGLIKQIKKLEPKASFEAYRDYLLDMNNIIK